MLDTVFGLPTHILVIHGVLVLIPVAALVTMVVAARTGWRRRFAWWVVLLDVVTVGATWVAKESGEQLFRRLREPAAARNHADLGSLMLWFTVALLAVAVLAALVRYRRGAAPTLVALLAVAVAAATIVWVVRVGHTGSQAVWKDRVSSTQAPGGD